MKYSDDMLQRQLTEIQQALIQFKTTQVATSDSWMPYTSSETVGLPIHPDPALTDNVPHTTWHYYRAKLLQETLEPALFLFYGLEEGSYERNYGGSLGWQLIDYSRQNKLNGFSVGNEFQNTVYFQLGEITVSNSLWSQMRNVRDTQYTVIVAGTQPAVFKLEEIDEATYRREARI